MFNSTTCRALLTAVAVFATTTGTQTLVSANAKTTEEAVSTQKEYLFHKASNLLEAKLKTIDPINPDGLTGLQNINGKFYYFNEDGTLHTGWQTFGENTVYYDENGEFTKGLETLEDEEGEKGIFYFNEDGILTTGWQEVDGKKFFFHENGKAETETFQEGDTVYVFNEDGEMTESYREVIQEEAPVQQAASNPAAGSSTAYTAPSQASAPQATAPAPAQSAPAPSAPLAPVVVDDGALGTISIGGYSARVFAGGSNNAVNQPIVDAPNSAVLMNYLGRQMIADHAHQGFSVIRSCGAGSVGTFCGRTIVCASSYQGTNTGYGIMLDDGRWADEVYDGTYIMYTCNDASGVSVTVTFWN